jgi:hypothetical protein
MGENQLGLEVTDDVTQEVVEPTELAPTQLNDLAVTTPEAMLVRAIDRGLPVESLERIMAMRRELKNEWAREQFYLALASFQSSCPSPAKTKVVHNKDGSERYRYAPIDVIWDTIKGPLAEHGFSLRTEPTQEEANEVVATVVLSHKDGHSEKATVRVPVANGGNMSDVQHVGEAKSYAKRYALLDVTGIVTADEDNDAMSFSDGVKYADFINALDACGDLESLRDTGKRYHEQLGKDGDVKGQTIVLAYYNQRKEQLSHG